MRLPLPPTKKAAERIRHREPHSELPQQKKRVGRSWLGCTGRGWATTEVSSHRCSETASKAAFSGAVLWVSSPGHIAASLLCSTLDQQEWVHTHRKKKPTIKLYCSLKQQFSSLEQEASPRNPGGEKGRQLSSADYWNISCIPKVSACMQQIRCQYILFLNSIYVSWIWQPRKFIESRENVNYFLFLAHIFLS